jgi:hypothetical protein
MNKEQAHQLMVKHLASPAHARACELIKLEQEGNEPRTASGGKPLNPVLVDWDKAYREGGISWAK